MTPSAQPRLLIDTDGNFACRWIDADSNRSVSFLQTIEITGRIHIQLSTETMQRLACFIFVGHLREKSLSEAFDVLLDLYNWDCRYGDLQIAHRISKPFQSRLSKVRQIERPPMVFSDDE
jgi:hypothetical protein